MPATGELGAERYQDKIAHLKKTREAYEAHDKGREALSKGKTEEALALAKQANRIEPGEGQFDALVGDVYLSQQQYQQALTNYDNAVKDNDKFFYFYVQRGLAKEKLGDQTGARKDLEKSTDLLPTATALNALGNLSLAQGNRQKAIQYFKEAVTSDSEPGRQAARSLVTLDLPANPNSYLRTDINLNQNRMVIVQISNPTPVSVRDVNVLVRYPDSQGRTREVVREIRGTIPPGKSALIEVGNRSRSRSSIPAIHEVRCDEGQCG